MTTSEGPTLRAKIISKFRFLSAGLGRVEPPRGICYSIREWCLKTQNNFFATQNSGWKSAVNAKNVTLAADQIPAVAGQSHSLFTAVIPDGRVFGKRTVAVLNSENELFAEISAGGSGGKIEHNRIFGLVLLPKVHVLKGCAAVLAAPSADVYYHWLFDLLPRLEILRLCNVPLESVDFFIVNGLSRAFQSETLTKLGLRHKAVSLEEFPHVKASRLLAPSLGGKAPDVPQWVCDFLQKNFLPAPEAGKIQKNRRIYVSRANAKRRFITNEAEVKSELESAGFVTVFLEHLSFGDQVNLFAQAEMVVGSHGSGFANLVFCSPGTKVVEIFPPNRVRFHFRNISRWVGLDYVALVGNSSNRWLGGRKNSYDITVDLMRLKEALK